MPACAPFTRHRAIDTYAPAALSSLQRFDLVSEKVTARVKGNLGQYLTLLGICSLLFYGVMVATGHLSPKEMPQFLVTAVIFLTAGRMARRVKLGDSEEETTDEATEQREPDTELVQKRLH